MNIIRVLAVAAVLQLLPHLLVGQEESGRSLDLTIDGVGLSVGDSRAVTGLRLNFRDRRLERVIGANVTIWSPYEYTGHVIGLALGAPVTGARRIDGVATGVFGVGASESIRGVTLVPIGAGAGGDLSGIALAGIGLGTGGELRGIGIGGVGIGAGGGVRGAAIGGVGIGVGENVEGLVAGGIGAAAGGSLRGIGLGGIGLGVGEDATGVVIGGIGAGIGGNMRGLSIGGVGVGVGGEISGLTIAGVGFGAGGDVSGMQIAGVGMGSGGTMRWVSVAGFGIGADAIEGLAAALAVGARDVRGIVIAPAYFRIEDGSIRGVNVSAYNDVRGTQRGLAIGLFNYARVLDGVQVGLINYAGNKSPGTRVLPLINFARAQ